MVWGYQATDLPPDTLKSTLTVTVTESAAEIYFQPRSARRPTGILFLPGGMVDPLAYTPLLKSLAASGHPARLIRLPYRCACTDSQVTALFSEVTKIVQSNPGTRWYLAGHSRGAMLATRYARESQSNIAGLVLIATTHPRDFDLSASHLKITKIQGTHDNIASLEAAKANSHLLPPGTLWITIPGANHVQFAYYGHQLLDGLPDITREQQQAALGRAVRRALTQ